MNALKHMEIIFIISAVLLGVTGYATAAAPAIERLPQVVRAVQSDVKMQVIVVKGKRWSGAKKTATV